MATKTKAQATDTTDEVTVTEQPTEATTEDRITPYKAAALINEQLGLDVPPQMLYTYVKNDKIPNVDKKILPADALKWGEELKARRAERAQKAEAKAKAELEGAEVTEAE